MNNSPNNSPPPYPAINPENNPGQGVQGEVNFAYLVKNRPQGRVNSMPWAGYWWPYADNGIHVATSKYDSTQGSPSSTQWELSHHGSTVPGVQSWWGHCNGWAAAAVLFKEPRAATTIGNTEFRVEDKKALLSEIAMEVSAEFYGHRSDESNDSSSLAFQDIFPNQFFLVLTNTVGKGTPLIMDRYTGYQVWNHPIAGYQISPITKDDYLGTDPSIPNVFKVLVTTQVWWLRDDVPGNILTDNFNFADGNSFDSRIFRFELWLDAPLQFDSNGVIQSSGNVILSKENGFVFGGVWRNGQTNLMESHPDYLWIPYSVSPSSGFSNPYLNSSWIAQYMAS